MVPHKFKGRGQRPTPSATVDNLVYILSQLNSAIGRKLAEVGAQTTTGLIGGDLRLAAAVADNRSRQEELAATDPTNPLRLFGIHTEATGGADPSASEALRARLEWRRVREEEKKTNRELTDMQKQQGVGGFYYAQVQNCLNKGALGFEETTTSDFKRKHGIQVTDALADYMDDEQLTARKLLELVNRRKFAKCDTGRKMVDEAYATNEAFSPVFREQGIHIGPENPFVKVNRRVKLLEERVTKQGKQIAQLQNANAKPLAKQLTINNFYGDVSAQNNNNA